MDDRVQGLVLKHGMLPVMWTIDSSDWRHVAAGAEHGRSLEAVKSSLPHAPGMRFYIIACV